MKRSIDQYLDKWKEDASRVPLMIRAARQVGKSYSVSSLGKRSFESTVTVNFETDEGIKECFTTLNAQKIVQELELKLGKKITPGKTLLFFDEIQACPRAIMALRYFKEEMQELHVISAGSLLEFAIEDQQFSFPVGRVQFLYMHPLSFMEFLTAMGKTVLKERIESVSLSDQSPSLHAEGLSQIKLYMGLGGMPAVIDKYLSSNSLIDATEVQNLLLSTYQSDFGKYASKTEHRHLQRLFEKAPLFVGHRVKYSTIDPHSPNPAREYKQAIYLLSKAGLIQQIYSTSANGFPLAAETNEKKFKLLYLDTGLFQRSLGTEPKFAFSDEAMTINKGQTAEQLVGQELLCYQLPTQEAKLYFWEREKATSSAEVDYLYPFSTNILPIEVKSGKEGKLKSMKIFLEEKKAPIGIKISIEPLSFDGNILTIPFYLISQMNRLISEALN